MSLTLLNIDNQYQIIVSIIFNNTTTEFRVITESTNDEQISAFICTSGSSHLSITETLLRNPQPIMIKSHDEKLLITTIILDINDEKYIVKSLTYNLTSKSYKIDREKFETWEKLLFLVFQNLRTFHLSKVSPRTLLQSKLWACTKMFEYFTLHF